MIATQEIAASLGSMLRERRGPDARFQRVVVDSRKVRRGDLFVALPGERIGYIAVHPDYDGRRELVDGLVFCNRTLGFVNAPALMQHIVRHLQDVTIDAGEYQAKRDFLYEGLTGIGYTLTKPQGAFYMFPKSPIEDDVEFTAALQEHNVLVVPGRGFGLPGYFRISYCVDDRTLEGSMAGFKKAFEALSR